MEEKAPKEVDNNPTDACVGLEGTSWMFGDDFGSMALSKMFSQICVRNSLEAVVDRRGLWVW